MRHIDRSHIRRLVDLDELDHAKEELFKKSPEERKKYIDDNAGKWSEIKAGLWQLGCGKCWYSEDELQVGEGHIEHYRPKNQVWQTTFLKDGYWWLAFEFENLILSHPTCNFRREPNNID